LSFNRRHRGRGGWTALAPKQEEDGRDEQVEARFENLSLRFDNGGLNAVPDVSIGADPELHTGNYPTHSSGFPEEDA